eukprot:7741010-Karenia_brevis.AAC.2
MVEQHSAEHTADVKLPPAHGKQHEIIQPQLAHLECALTSNSQPSPAQLEGYRLVVAQLQHVHLQDDPSECLHDFTERMRHNRVQNFIYSCRSHLACT